MSKLKAFADDISNVAEMVEFVIDEVENIVGKGENAGYQHFLLFPQYFQNAVPRGHQNSGLCGKEVMDYFGGVMKPYATGFVD